MANKKAFFYVARKSDYTPEFNRRRKTRRAKARHDEVNRKRNRKCGYKG